MNALQLVWSQGDGVSRAVALILLARSVSAWVLIFWKTWVLQRARHDLARIVPAFWDAPDLDVGARLLAERDRLPQIELAIGQRTDGLVLLAQGQKFAQARVLQRHAHAGRDRLQEADVRVREGVLALGMRALADQVFRARHEIRERAAGVHRRRARVGLVLPQHRL